MEEYYFRECLVIFLGGGWGGIVIKFIYIRDWGGWECVCGGEYFWKIFNIVLKFFFYKVFEILIFIYEEK